MMQNRENVEIHRLERAAQGVILTCNEKLRTYILKLPLNSQLHSPFPLLSHPS